MGGREVREANPADGHAGNKRQRTVSLQPAVRADPSLPAEKSSQLASIIEFDIIPRLILTRRRGVGRTPTQNFDNLKLNQYVDEFSDLVIEHDVSSSLAYFEALVARGADIEALYLGLLAPTARRLGVLWDEDINSFVDVTRGLWHLQLLVRRSTPTEYSLGSDKHGRALFAPLPGELHTFGLTMIEETFRNEGWQVWSDPQQSFDELASIVRGHWLDVVGLSCASKDRVDDLRSAVASLRKSSMNPGLVILVGGKVFVDQPELYISVGADATASDGRHALTQVAGLFEAKAICS